MSQQSFEYDPTALNWDTLERNINNCFKNVGYDKNVRPSTMEGCVVRVSDMISYLGKDFEDAVALEIIKRDSLPIEIRRVLGAKNAEIVNVLTTDIIQNSYKKRCISFSDDVFNAFEDMKKFNYEYIYGCKLIKEQKNKFENMLRALFEVYQKDLRDTDSNQSIFTNFINRFQDDYLRDNDEDRIIADFIAGMTDQYFIKQYEMRFMPQHIDYGEKIYVH